MTPRATIYALLSVAGLVGTWFFNVEFMRGDGSFLGSGFLAGGFANPAASSFTVDLLVAFLAYLVWLFPEAKRVGVPHAWVYLLLGFFVAFAFSYPLFLFVRERALARAAASAAA